MADEQPPTWKALLIGIQYEFWPLKDAVGGATESDDPRLHGPHSNVDQLHQLLLKHRYTESNIKAMKDLVGHPSHLIPTRENILRETENLVKDSGPNSHFVFLYAGHGDNIRGPKAKRERDGKDEAIVPLDAVIYDEAKYILDDELNINLLGQLNFTSSLFAIIDTCHSATMLDLSHRKCNANTFRIIVPTPSPTATDTSSHDTTGTSSPIASMFSTTPWNFPSDALEWEPEQQDWVDTRVDKSDISSFGDDVTPTVKRPDAFAHAQEPVARVPKPGFDLTPGPPEEVSTTGPAVNGELDPFTWDLENSPVVNDSSPKLGDEVSADQGDSATPTPTPKAIVLSRNKIGGSDATNHLSTGDAPEIGERRYPREKGLQSTRYVPDALTVSPQAGNTKTFHAPQCQSSTDTSSDQQNGKDSSNLPSQHPTSTLRSRKALPPIEVDPLRLPLRGRARQRLGCSALNECNGECHPASPTSRPNVISLSACADWERSLEKAGISMTNMIINAFGKDGTLSVQHALNTMHYIYNLMFEHHALWSQDELAKNENVESNLGFKKKVVGMSKLQRQNPQVSSMTPLPLDACIRL